MTLKILAVFVLSTIALAPATAPGQAGSNSVSSHANQDVQSNKYSNTALPPASSQDSGISQRDTGHDESLSDHQQPHITVATPPPAPASWPMHDRIAWGSNLVLTVLGYIGIMIGITTLKKIERQTKYAEDTAQAALDSANSALLNAQAIANSERPWLLITVEPSTKVANSFRIMATNRGRTPARVVATSDRIGIAIDESYLPKNPEFAKEEPTALSVPMILLPGESAVIQPFGREDVKWVCKTEESLRRIELNQDKIFLYGKVIYRDLIATHDKVHETDWCCRYIHGERISDLVITGPLEYIKHT